MFTRLMAGLVALVLAGAATLLFVCLLDHTAHEAGPRR